MKSLAGECHLHFLELLSFVPGFLEPANERVEPLGTRVQRRQPKLVLGAASGRNRGTGLSFASLLPAHSSDQRGIGVANSPFVILVVANGSETKVKGVTLLDLNFGEEPSSLGGASGATALLYPTMQYHIARMF
jgi:hypothetical protein